VSAALVSTRQEPPRIAFAVGRPVGNAVARNRVRRRLRSALREHHELLQPGWGYLVSTTPAATTATYRELADALHVILRGHSGEMS
jgi:ribonuclease P protein component